MAHFEWERTVAGGMIWPDGLRCLGADQLRDWIIRGMLAIRAALMKRLLAFCFGLSVGVAGAGEIPPQTTDKTYFSVNPTEAILGQSLFWDPILSGNRNISCGTCHHPKFATTDGVSLGVGEGGIGLGRSRRPDPENMPEARIPRNAPALFNLGAKEFTVLFHDGRIEADAARPSGFRTPLGEDMLEGFDSVLSAQSMFPVLSSDEMAGHYSENDVAQAARQGRLTGVGGAWDILARRVAEIPEYQQQFEQVYPEIAAGRPLDFTDISNAIAAFIAFEWRSDESNFDMYLQGLGVLSAMETLGMDLFYGGAGCSQCHSGVFQTDHGFYAMGVPQIGPGKSASFETYSGDIGRQRVTGREVDRFAFRTPSLRNVTKTAPYGHDGAYLDLQAFVQTHLDPAAALTNYDRSRALFPELPDAEDWKALDDPAEISAISDAIEIEPVVLGADEVAAIIAFLATLEDPMALDGKLGIPETVPSGLPVDR